MFISCIKSKKTTETAVICHVWVPCCVVSYDFRIKLCSVRLYFKLFVGGLVSYLRDLYLFANNGAQHILCCVLVFLRLVYPMFPILWIVHYWLPKVFSKIYFLSSDLHQCLQLLKLWVRLLSMWCVLDVINLLKMCICRRWSVVFFRLLNWSPWDSIYFQRRETPIINNSSNQMHCMLLIYIDLT